ncbi:hypothetical protein VTO42DRAFT_72 [Malbranchea cinnamomea]
MPPVNSPTETPPSERSPSASASQLPRLVTVSSSIADLSGTLMSHPEDDIHNENVRFLRTRRPGSAFQHARTRRMNTYQDELLAIESLYYPHRREPTASRDEPSAGEARTDQLAAQEATNARALSGARRRMLSYEEQMNALRENIEARRSQNLTGTSIRISGHREEEGTSNNGPTSVQSPNPQVLYVWTADQDDDDAHSRGNLNTLVEEMWHARFPREEGSPSAAATRIEEQMLEPFISSIRYGGPTAALLESARRNSRIAGTRPYVPDDTEDQETDRERRPWVPSGAPRAGTLRAASVIPLHLVDHRNSYIIEMYLKDPSVHRMKEAIAYLDRVRFSSSYEESLSEAAVGGFVKLDYFLRNEKDFVLNTASIARPTECSWLRPGSVFSGFQQATHYTASTRATASSRPTDPVIVNGSDPHRITVSTSNGRRYWARNSVDLGDSSSQLTEPKTEHWPVKVTIHSIDYDTMTLSGTMEAYNIPDKSDPNQKSHIVTYLEGEIIDFNIHTLQTKNFKAGLDIDTCYWKQLEPFKGMAPDDIVKSLVSQKWMTEHLVKGWILMRWKERCFVAPSHSQQGLTISGFYYISLRRDNGHVEGMYHDPGSTPFQQLKLEPEMKQSMMFPAYEFR